MVNKYVIHFWFIKMKYAFDDVGIDRREHWTVTVNTNNFKV